MAQRVLRLAAAVLLSFAPALAQQKPEEPDRDGDGLSDFQEVHKYLTDPDRADTDGDGIPDGDWPERREYAYTVRSVVQVMRPVTPEYLCDDMQDARVLDETKDMVELEVIHYPFSTAQDAIQGDPAWRDAVAADPALRPWLAPGPTADWTPELRMQIETALAEDGIDFAALDDAELVRRVAKWLCARAESHYDFSSFVTAFDERGAPFVPEELRERMAERGMSERPLAEQWPREISAAGMFDHRARGSCSSSAIYLTGCLRALGVPTRIVLVIPAIDADDESEVQTARRLQNHEVRRAVVNAARTRAGSWSSHTFNEVFVAGRWRRLNYEKLGQGTFGREIFGLCTHVATFRDWADAHMPKTIGKRQTLLRFDDAFGTENPYSTISLRDEFGAHCTRANPDVPLVARVTAVGWSDAPELPEYVRQWFLGRLRTDLIARVEGVDSADLSELLAIADGRASLTSDGADPVEVVFDPGCMWYLQDHGLVRVAFATEPHGLVVGLPYRFVPRNEKPRGRWDVADDLRVIGHR